MSRIHILDDALRNQIAAGEVVERPSSAVKELTENALDAGAEHISIRLEQAGIKSIEVEDDGTGMNKEDTILSVERYSTSKIQNKNDLFAIHTFGFRGEALASIASVSRFTLESKDESSQSGTRMQVHFGYCEQAEICVRNRGSRVIVEDLFENIPARKKFLKTEGTELKQCLQILEDIAMVNPHTAFSVSHNGKTILQLETESKEERVKNLIGKDTFATLLPVAYSGHGIEISGFVSRPGEVFKTRNFQKIFINKRPVKDGTISAAVTDAFHSLLEKGSFPAYYIFINIRPDLVDVNVHPRKSEVKFLNSHEVFHAVKQSLLQSFEKEHKAFTLESPSFTSKAPPLAAFPTSSTSSYSRSSYASPSYSQRSWNSPESISFSPSVATPFQVLPLEHASDELCGYKIIGQAARKFIILEKENRIIFLDQHAVHERARYDRLMKEYQESSPISQNLLLAEIIELQSNEYIQIQNYRSFLEKIGFLLEPFGNNSISVSAIPAHLRQEDLKNILLELMNELDVSGTQRSTDAMAEKALTYLSCRGAIMFGDTLSMNEMEQIVKDWLYFAKGLTCPHGRPLGFEMSVSEMEKKVGR